MAPGEVRDIDVGVRLHRAGKTEHVFLRIRTNDPDSPDAEYSFFAKCPGPVVVKPQAVHFEVIEGKTADAVLPVRDAQGNRLPPTTDLQFSCDSPYLEVKRVQADDGGLGVAVELKAGTPRGNFKSEVVLSLPGVEGTLGGAFTGSVVGPIKVAPHTVKLPVPMGSASTRSLSSRVMKTNYWAA